MTGMVVSMRILAGDCNRVWRAAGREVQLRLDWDGASQRPSWIAYNLLRRLSMGFVDTDGLEAGGQGFQRRIPDRSIRLPSSSFAPLPYAR